MKLILTLLVFVGASFANAASDVEGAWKVQDGSKIIHIQEFSDKLTFSTRAYYSNGAPSDYFYEFKMKTPGQVAAGEILQGRVRSVDGYYGCLFDEPAELQLTEKGTVKIHYPLLTFHRVTRSVRDGKAGYRYRRVVDWNGWGWIERITYFPIERWRVISSECVIDQRNWQTQELTASE